MASDPESTGPRRRRWGAQVALATAVIVAAALAGCATLWPRLGRLAHEVPVRPGACAWAPDSQRLACTVDGGLQLFDAKGQPIETYADLEPSYLDWAPGPELLVVDGSGAEARLLRLGAAVAPQTVELAVAPVAARWWGDGERVALFSLEQRTMSIGLLVKLGLHAIEGGTTRQMLLADTVYPTTRSDVDVMSGWVHAGARPVAETQVVLEFHDPPRFPPFLRLLEIDPARGEPHEWTRYGGKRFSFAMSWSPDGKRLALTDESGGLVVQELGGEQQLIDFDGRGTTPSWHPSAELVHLGGWLIPTDGGAPRQLLHNATYAVGFWAPDGGRLALVDQGDLYIFDLRQELGKSDGGLDPAGEDLRRRLRLLRRLHRRALISDQDFDARRTKLLRQGGLLP